MNQEIIEYNDLALQYPSELVSPWAPKLWKRSPVMNYLLSGIVVFFISLFFVIYSEQCQHWCLIPLFICGLITGSDIIAWLRKEIDVFDLRFIVGAFLFLNTFLAPLLHLANGIYAKIVVMPNPASQFGYTAILNILCLILYKWMHNISFNKTRDANSYWKIDLSRLIVIVMPVILISLAALLVIQIFFGGLYKVVGEIQFTAASAEYAAHLSWLLMLADPFPILLLILITYFIAPSPERQVGLLTVLILLFVIFLIQFFLAGQRASRTALLGVLLIATIMMHFRLRPFSLKFVLIGILFVLAFSYLYDFRKKLGPEGWKAFYSGRIRESMSYERGGATFLTTLLGDFARADIHAYILYRTAGFSGNVELMHGRSYAMAVLTSIPRAIWKNKPRNPKVEMGAAILGYPVNRETSHQYGLTGEAMLNFGYLGIIPAYITFGYLLGLFRKKVYTLEFDDARFYLVPILYLTLTLSINTDMDNLFFNFLRMFTLPFIVIFWSSNKVKNLIDIHENA